MGRRVNGGRVFDVGERGLRPLATLIAKERCIQTKAAAGHAALE